MARWTSRRLWTMSRNWWPRADTLWMFGVRGHLLQKGGVSQVAGGRAGQGLIILPPGKHLCIPWLSRAPTPSLLRQDEFSGLWFSMVRSNCIELDSQSSGEIPACLSVCLSLVAATRHIWGWVSCPFFAQQKEHPSCLTGITAWVEMVLRWPWPFNSLI